MKIASWCLVLSFLFPAVATAEIYKVAVPTANGIKFYWWPVLPPVSGWSHNESISRANDVNMLIPQGWQFSNAPAVIYAKALYKPRIPLTKTLGQLINDDLAQSKSNVPGLKIAKLTSIQDGDGKMLDCFSLSPPKQGSWELIAYGEEEDFYLVFVVSGQSEKALAESRNEFLQLIKGYKEKQ